MEVNMKIRRHDKIRELISKYEIETQEELAERLNMEGFNVTQATISRDIRELKPENSVYRELALVKVKAAPDQRGGVISIVDIFRAKVIDVGSESLTVEITGNQAKIEAFLNLLDGYEILELARTGIAGLGRGTENVVYFEE